MAKIRAGSNSNAVPKAVPCLEPPGSSPRRYSGVRENRWFCVTFLLAQLCRRCCWFSSLIFTINSFLLVTLEGFYVLPPEGIPIVSMPATYQPIVFMWTWRHWKHSKAQYWQVNANFVFLNILNRAHPETGAGEGKPNTQCLPLMEGVFLLPL